MSEKNNVVGAIGKRFVVFLDEKNNWCALDKKHSSYIHTSSVNQEIVNNMIKNDSVALRTFLINNGE